ncbi:MAG: hypothetical protein U0T84_01325 [Chitinophagales bacterium]
MKYSLLVVGSLLGALSACHQNPATPKGPVSYADSALSVIQVVETPQGTLLTRENTYYDLIAFADKAEDRQVLLKLIKREQQLIDSNGGQHQFMLKGHSLRGKGADWTAEAAGAEVVTDEKVLVIHQMAKDGEEDTYTMISLLNGTSLMRYTYGEVRALIPNTSHKRFFGYLSKQAAGERPEGFATITYTGSDATIQRLNIRLKANKIFPEYTPELTMVAAEGSGNTIAGEGKTVILAHAPRNFKSEDIGNFALKVNYFLPNQNDPISILLPVTNDRVDLKAAQYDRNTFDISE